MPTGQWKILGIRGLYPNQKRADWTKDIEGIEIIAGGDPFESEWLYWVGCAGSFDDKNKKVSQAMAKTLKSCRH
ncbi:MAG: hypothetical protein ACJ0F6_00135 [Acidimicrobiales bacterium]